MATELDRLFSRIADEHDPERHRPERRHVNYAALTKLANWPGRVPIRIVTDPSMPPGYFEMRSGSQRIGVWVDGTEHHDRGDEDRSER